MAKQKKESIEDIKKKTALELKHDFQTRPDICAYMASLMPNFGAGLVSILEPTPGDGNLAKAIRHEMGKRTRPVPSSFMLDTPIDYFIARPLIMQARYDCIVMNPPFSHHTAILDNAPTEWIHSKEYAGIKFGYQITLELLSRTNHLITLLPWFTIADSDVRLRTMYNYGIKSITALPRAAFQYARVQTCIIEFERGHTGPIEFKVFEMLQEGSKHNHPKLL